MRFTNITNIDETTQCDRKIILRGNNRQLPLLIMTVQTLRSTRIAAEIPASLLAAKAGVNRSRLSNLERGYAYPTEDELHRLTGALEQLVDAKAVMQRTAAAIGWPLSEVR